MGKIHCTIIIQQQCSILQNTNIQNVAIGRIYCHILVYCYTIPTSYNGLNYQVYICIDQYHKMVRTFIYYIFLVCIFQLLKFYVLLTLIQDSKCTYIYQYILYCYITYNNTKPTQKTSKIFSYFWFIIQTKCKPYLYCYYAYLNKYINGEKNNKSYVIFMTYIFYFYLYIVYMFYVHLYITYTKYYLYVSMRNYEQFLCRTLQKFLLQV
eukprot:TRINITY_DN8524_c0_g1_i6.p2 TRINITY_DN8524_c0_g1~~TRINITY_DN8524_c0_g1_i6.p2  ORF type:complete len:209 (-),score=-33.92 TRINITY_DN8524_c0_g1_i6:341-967(-)